MFPTTPITPDGELAHRVIHGPAPDAAFDALYARHATRLLAFLRDRFPTVADDAAQEAWTRLFACLRRGESRELTNFRAWLFRIASNVALDEFRRARVLPLNEVAEPPDREQGDPIESLLDGERKAVVERCLEKLEGDYRKVLSACSLGQKPTEIAAQLGISRELVDQRKFRGLKALRTCVERHLP
jgi:RNA polymerase sigma-70 factor, ECF subfamily